MKRLFYMMKKCNLKAVIICLCIIESVISVLSVVNSKILSDIYNAIYNNGKTVITLLTVFAVVSVSISIISYLSNMWRVRVIEDRSCKLRISLFSKTMCADSMQLQNININDIINNVSHSTEYVKLIISNMQLIFSMVFKAISSYAILITTDIRLTCIITALLIVLSIATYVLGKKSTKYSESRGKYWTNVIGVCGRLKNYFVVKSFCREKYEIENQMAVTSNKLKDVAIKKRKIDINISIIIDIVYDIIMVSIIGYGIYNHTECSAIILAVSLLDALFGIACNFGNIANDFSEMIAINDRYYKSFSAIEREEDGTIRLEQFNSSIEFKNVSFSYNKSEDVLKDISINIPKGIRIGIYGPSGEGKSTFINLINRFYKCSSGNIYIDNIDINDITAESLRSKIGVVTQDIYLFDGNIEENIKYGNLNATEEQIIEAAKAANAYEFICKFKDGFKTNIGRDGIKLSGGQKQRISIARMFLANPDIIILDEATSKLDNESEKLVQDAIDNLQGGKTVISIAHRLTTLDNCDYLVGIKNHTIYESGTKKELEKDKNSLYYKLRNM